MLTPRGVSIAHWTRTKFGRAGNLSNVITHAKFQIDWNKIVPLTKVEVSCFSTTEADAINTAKPCRVRMIRPTLEFNSNIWNPTKKYLMDKLDNIQRRFTKRVPSLSYLSYLERLSAFGLEPLELRRLKFDLIQYIFLPSLSTTFVP